MAKKISIKKKNIDHTPEEQEESSIKDKQIERDKDKDDVLNLEKDSLFVEDKNSIFDEANDSITNGRFYSTTDSYSEEKNVESEDIAEIEEDIFTSSPDDSEPDLPTFGTEDPSDDIFGVNDYDPPTTSPKGQTPITLTIDPELTYFFVMGNTTAGKSAMLSGLLFYLKTAGIGQLQPIGDNSQTNHQKGEVVLNNMIRRVREGVFIEGTRVLDGSSDRPKELNLEFQPSDASKDYFPFCLLEMAGEDLKKVQIGQDGSGGAFDKRIAAYLEHPDCKLVFICVIDGLRPTESEDLIDEFISHINRKGFENHPILFTVNKWDLLKINYESPKEFINKKMPVLKGNLLDQNRSISYMGFSLGETYTDAQSKVRVKYNPTDSEKLFNWMYETSMGTSFPEERKLSFMGKLKKSLGL